MSRPNQRNSTGMCFVRFCDVMPQRSLSILNLNQTFSGESLSQTAILSHPQTKNSVCLTSAASMCCFGTCSSRAARVANCRRLGSNAHARRLHSPRASLRTVHREIQGECPENVDPECACCVQAELACRASLHDTRHHDHCRARAPEATPAPALIGLSKLGYDWHERCARMPIPSHWLRSAGAPGLG